MENQAGTEIEKYVKRQYYLMLVMAICAVCVLVVVIIAAVILVPKMSQTLADIDAAMENLNAMLRSFESTMEGLAVLTDELGPGLQSIEEVTAGLQNIDFGELNQAIRDLSSVVAPLAKLFGR